MEDLITYLSLLKIMGECLLEGFFSQWFASAGCKIKLLAKYLFWGWYSTTFLHTSYDRCLGSLEIKGGWYHLHRPQQVPYPKLDIPGGGVAVSLPWWIYTPVDFDCRWGLTIWRTFFIISKLIGQMLQILRSLCKRTDHSSADRQHGPFTLGFEGFRSIMPLAWKITQILPLPCTWLEGCIAATGNHSTLPQARQGKLCETHETWDVIAFFAAMVHKLVSSCKSTCMSSSLEFQRPSVSTFAAEPCQYPVGLDCNMNSPSKVTTTSTETWSQSLKCGLALDGTALTLITLNMFMTMLTKWCITQQDVVIPHPTLDQAEYTDRVTNHHKVREVYGGSPALPQGRFTFSQLMPEQILQTADSWNIQVPCHSLTPTWRSDDLISTITITFHCLSIMQFSGLILRPRPSSLLQHSSSHPRNMEIVVCCRRLIPSMQHLRNNTLYSSLGPLRIMSHPTAMELDKLSENSFAMSQVKKLIWHLSDRQEHNILRSERCMNTNTTKSPDLSLSRLNFRDARLEAGNLIACTARVVMYLAIVVLASFSGFEIIDNNEDQKTLQLHEMLTEMARSTFCLAGTGDFHDQYTLLSQTCISCKHLSQMASLGLHCETLGLRIASLCMWLHTLCSSCAYWNSILAGAGWGTRLKYSLLAGCIPLVIADRVDVSLYAHVLACEQHNIHNIATCAMCMTLFTYSLLSWSNFKDPPCFLTLWRQLYLLRFVACSCPYHEDQAPLWEWKGLFGNFAQQFPSFNWFIGMAAGWLKVYQCADAFWADTSLSRLCHQAGASCHLSVARATSGNHVWSWQGKASSVITRHNTVVNPKWMLLVAAVLV